MLDFYVPRNSRAVRAGILSKTQNTTLEWYASQVKGFFKIGFDVKKAGRNFCQEPFIFLAKMLNAFVCDFSQAPWFPVGTSQQHRSTSYGLFKYNFNLD